MIGKRIRISHPHTHLNKMVDAIILDKVLVSINHYDSNEMKHIYQTVDKYLISIISDNEKYEGVFLIEPEQVRKIID